jgi:hypothetical protein
MSKVGVATLTLFLVTCLTPPVVADDHPFALVNVVSLFEAFNEDEDIPVPERLGRCSQYASTQLERVRRPPAVGHRTSRRRHRR